jgi:hypothetical protein
MRSREVKVMDDSVATDSDMDVEGHKVQESAVNVPCRHRRKAMFLSKLLYRELLQLI